MRYPGKGPHPIQSLYPRDIVARGYPSRYFGENELSPGLITLSVLPTSHPLGFQPKWVRSSTQFNPRFNLLMGRSHRFRVCSIRQFRPIQTRFPLGFVPEGLNQAVYHNSPDHYAKGTPSPVTVKVIGLRPLVSTWFQVHIPPLAGVLLIFQSPYWFTIGRQGVFSLTGWSPWIQSRFHVTGPTQVPLGR